MRRLCQVSVLGDCVRLLGDDCEVTVMTVLGDCLVTTVCDECVMTVCEATV